jgi:chemotaxis protein MotB
MARRKNHEEHVNHEAWAIPYGDLITLLLAFFVVMYAVSSVNEGKYRVLAESLVAAFRGAPKSVRPIQVGDNRSTEDEGRLNVEMRSLADPGLMQREMQVPEPIPKPDILAPSRASAPDVSGREMQAGLLVMADEIREAMSDLIARDEVRIRESDFWVEVEVNTDILFPTGVAEVSDSALPTLRKLADILAPFPNPIRVEGHTDDVPIDTPRFPSNWELSAGRAANVVRLFQDSGIDPVRLAAIGLGEHRPVADNETREGRNRNRRVVVVIMAGDRLPEQYAGRDSEQAQAVPDDAPVADEPAPGESAK